MISRFLLSKLLKKIVVKLKKMYIILHHMLSTPCLVKRSLPYTSIITRILKYFQVPITEPTFLNSKELGDEAIANLGFI